MECTQIRKQSDLIRRMARQYIHILRVHCLPVPLVDRRFQNLAVTKLVQHEHARSGALRRLVIHRLASILDLRPAFHCKLFLD